MKRWFLVSAMIIIFAGFGVVWAQMPPPTLDIIGHIGGAVDAVATDGDYLYVGQGPRILVYDLSVPDNPVKIAQTDVLDGSVVMLEVVDDTVYAFLSSGHFISNQFIVFDVNLPTAPERLDAIRMPSGSEWGTGDMHIAGGYAYITGKRETRIVDISDPARPQDIGVYPTGGAVTLLEENRLLVGMTILDVSDPATPLNLGRLDAPGVTDILDAVVADHLLYLSTTEGLVILDMTDILHPILVGRSETEMSVGLMTLAGSRLYVGADADRLRLFDVSDPQTPIELNTLALADLGHDGLAVAGEFVYVGAKAAGLFIIDTTDPADLQMHQASQGLYDPVNVFADEGPYVYVSDESGLSILDVTVPDALERVGAIAITPRDMAIQHPTIYIVDGGLRVFDVSDPQNPAEIGSLALNGQADRIRVIGNRAYINSVGLHIIDISDPTNPQEIAEWPIPVHDISVEGENVYVYYAGETFDIYEITASAAPKLLVQAFIPRDWWDYEGILDMQVSDGLAYLMSFDRLWIFDISNPNVPKLTHSFDAGYGAFDVVGRHLYLLDRSGRLKLIDTNNAQHPVLLAVQRLFGIDWFEFYQNKVGLAAHGDTAYVANSNDGLYLLGHRVSPPPPTPTPTPTPSPPSLLEFVDRQGGATRTIAAQDNHLYHGRGHHLIAVRIDTDEEQHPMFTEIGKSELLPNIVTSVAARGRYAYVMAGSLLVFDVSDPTHPTIVARPSTMQGDIHLVDQRLYLNSGARLQTFALTDPSAPDKIGDSELPNAPQALQLTDTRAYTLENGSLAIYDLVDPQNPTYLGGMYAESAGLAAIGDTVYLLENHMCAFVAGEDLYGPYLNIIDASDPTNPVHRGGMGAPGEYACGSRSSDIFAWDDRVYISQPRANDHGGPGVSYAIDVSDPEHPQLIGEMDVGWRTDVAAISVSEDYLLVFYANEYLGAFSTESFDLVGGYYPGGAIETIHHDGDRLGATTATWWHREYYGPTAEHWMQLFDVGNFDGLEPTGRFWLGSDILDLVMKKQYIYGLHSHCCEQDATELKIMDISDPQEPQTLYEDWAHKKIRIYIEENVAYLSGPRHDGELLILDISDCTQPQELSVLTVEGRSLKDIVLHGNYAYLLTDAGIRAIDLHDLETAVQTGSATIAIGSPTNIWHSGHFLYALTRRTHSPGYDFWLYRVDVSDPAHPSEIFVHKLGRSAGEFTAHMAEQFLYIAGQGSVRSWEIMSGAAPVERGIYYTGGAANDVVAEGREVYVADGDAGVLWLRNPLVPPKLWLPLMQR